MPGKTKTLLAGSLLASLLPIWRSGGRTHLNFWEWVINHTIWGPPVEYVPEEDYKQQLRRNTPINPLEFYRPDLVQDIAANFPHEEDGFILTAWHFVTKAILYEPDGSEMVFVNGEILCENCHMPGSVLMREQGNCVAKSALLASLLVTRLPPEHIHLIIGTYGANRELGGHAWIEVYRYGDWYLLETTKEPEGWFLADDLFPLYDPGVLITTKEVCCLDDFFCESF